ncbi:phosphatase PAP2 family protein [Micromonospora psammae]|uniref:phosphatase PAP2 family protein n=1 Tax=Micromonospora sp. CPCC 205556 TaxID=3122398 RepID=UPI002FF0D89D
MVHTGTTDVPDISEEWYRDFVEVADSAPGPVQWFAGHFTEGAILLLGALFLLAAVPRLRHGGARQRAVALVAPVTVVLAYASSEGLKLVFDQDRPCRGAIDIVAARCPPPGDWSFPSNHATIAGALAAATLLLSRRLGLVAAVLALVAALSRVFVGVHYPHDVGAGLLLGALLAAVATPLAAGPLAKPLRRWGAAHSTPSPSAPTATDPSPWSSTRRRPPPSNAAQR